MKKVPLLVIAGPTASGKTDLAIKIANEFNSEIISADSMQIYRYMNIGTAKPTIEERESIPHHMIDIVDPDEEYNVALYQKQAKNYIYNTAKIGKLPILVGGSGLYVNSIIYPMNFTDAVDDPNYRNYLRVILEEKGAQYLHGLLMKVDTATAAKLHPNDTRRIIRALEVYHLTGKTMKQYQQNYREMESPFKLLLYGLTMNRKALYHRINVRVDKMISDGLVEEVNGLLDRGYSKDLVSMQGLGYKEIVAYLEGYVTLDEAVETLKRDTRRFAKRQLTWFRRENRIHWIDLDKYYQSAALVDCLSADVENKLLSN